MKRTHVSNLPIRLIRCQLLGLIRVDPRHPRHPWQTPSRRLQPIRTPAQPPRRGNGQMTVLYLLTPAWQASGASGAAMSLLIAGIAAFLLVYAQHAATRGWLR